jgi:hypothetical protein
MEHSSQEGQRERRLATWERSAIDMEQKSSRSEGGTTLGPWGERGKSRIRTPLSSTFLRAHSE